MNYPGELNKEQQWNRSLVGELLKNIEIIVVYLAKIIDFSITKPKAVEWQLVLCNTHKYQYTHRTVFCK